MNENQNRIVILYDQKGNRLDKEMNYNIISLIRNAHFWWTFTINEKRKIYNFISINRNVKVPCTSQNFYKLIDLRQALDYELTFEPEPFLITDNNSAIPEDKGLMRTSCGNSLVERTVDALSLRIYSLIKNKLEFVTEKDAKYKYNICMRPERKLLPVQPGRTPDTCEEI